jgi:hypothetical protein
MEKRLTGAQTKARQIQGRRRKNCVEKKKKGAQTISTRISWGSGEERGQNLFRAGGNAAARAVTALRLAFLAASTSASSPEPVLALASCGLRCYLHTRFTDHTVYLQLFPSHDISHEHRKQYRDEAAEKDEKRPHWLSGFGGQPHCAGDRFLID